MSAIDVLFLGAVLIVGLWWIVFPNRARHILRLAPLGLLALAALQIALEGFYWQFVLVYAVIGVLDLLSIFSRTPPAGALAVIGRLGLAAMLLIAIGPFLLLLPAPTLPQPSGPYAVGSQVFRWVDEARAEPTAPGEKRNVVAQAWYPAAAGAKGAPPSYMDGTRNLPDTVSLFPGFMLRRIGDLDPHAVRNAPASSDKPRWPVVIFSPGYGGPRAVYSGIAAGLASRGYIVLALDHPFESAVTELADGRIAADANAFPASGSQAERDAFMVAQLNTRVADIRFAIDQLARPDAIGPLAAHLDLEHIAAIGHSFGGASSAVAAYRDPRIGAAANIDGALYGAVENERLQRPFLLIDSDHAETGHSEKTLGMARRLLANLDAPGWAYEIRHANHYSFTDAELFFALPGRWLLTAVMGGGRGAADTHAATVDLLDAFLSGPLGREPASIEAAAAKHAGIVGGPAK